MATLLLMFEERIGGEYKITTTTCVNGKKIPTGKESDYIEQYHIKKLNEYGINWVLATKDEKYGINWYISTNASGKKLPDYCKIIVKKI